MAITVSSKSTSPTPATKRQAERRSKPSEDEIRILAYRLYEQRREEGVEGDAASDWIQAERQLEEEE